MPKTRTLQEEIVTALKTVGVVTKKDLKNYPTRNETKKMITEIVMQASDAITSGMEVMFKNVPT
ncbi:MAG TPA: hypothetical protein VLE44_00255, partial [Candidatus Saccharimonadales bacterium]|nr:hypothetical protein [Candidatus Saccharimonadales bacterium]